MMAAVSPGSGAVRRERSRGRERGRERERERSRERQRQRQTETETDRHTHTHTDTHTHTHLVRRRERAQQLSGWFHKQGESVRSRKLRYFSRKGRVLEYYKAVDGKPKVFKGFIDLDEATRVEVVNMTTLLIVSECVCVCVCACVCV